ncbi:MAG: RND transporter, partial [Algicola sp.]|nr:RND transporter [Algicola sp.]
MDITIQKKQSSWIKKHWYIPASIAAFASVVIAATQMEFSAYTTQRNNLMIGTVERGELTVNVRGNGLLVPNDVRWIAANVDGRV